MIISALAVLTAAVVAFPFGKPKETNATLIQGKCLGVDVSDHNGWINWAKAKAGGVEFAIIRIGWGDDMYSQDDGKAEYNMQQCERYGIPYGVYIYSYALSSPEVDSEIAHTIRMIKGHNPTLGIWFDMEDADGYKVRNNFNPYTHGSQLTDFCVKFVRGMKAKGYYDVGVYANPDYFSNVLSYNRIKAEGMIWLAFWGVNPERYGYAFDMWQYSASGQIPGGNGVFDMNWIFAGSPLFTKVVSVPVKIDEYYRTQGVPIVYGDVNGDGVISLSDLTQTKMHILGRLILRGDAFTCADVNRDGKVTLSDLTLMKQYILSRIDSTLPKDPADEPQTPDNGDIVLPIIPTGSSNNAAPVVPQDAGTESVTDVTADAGTESATDVPADAGTDPAQDAPAVDGN